MVYYVYILECLGTTLKSGGHPYYTGQTSRLPSRVLEHIHGNGGRYTRGRLPVRLCLVEQYESRGDAMRREHQIKKLSRKQKEELLVGWGGGISS